MNFVFYKNVQVLRNNGQYIDKLAETSQIDTEKMKNGVFCWLNEKEPDIAWIKSVYWMGNC